MIVGIGIDLIELDRIRRAYERRSMRFIRMILHSGEQKSMPDNVIPWLAARFAAKEAAVKALGTGVSNGVALKDIETYNDAWGKPHLRLHNKAHERAVLLKVTTMHLSLTHGRDTAAAVVILESFPSAP